MDETPRREFGEHRGFRLFSTKASFGNTFETKCHEFELGDSDIWIFGFKPRISKQSPNLSRERPLFREKDRRLRKVPLSDTRHHRKGPPFRDTYHRRPSSAEFRARERELRIVVASFTVRRVLNRDNGRVRSDSERSRGSHVAFLALQNTITRLDPFTVSSEFLKIPTEQAAVADRFSSASARVDPAPVSRGSFASGSFASGSFARFLRPREWWILKAQNETHGCEKKLSFFSEVLKSIFQRKSKDIYLSDGPSCFWDRADFFEPSSVRCRRRSGGETSQRRASRSGGETSRNRRRVFEKATNVMVVIQNRPHRVLISVSRETRSRIATRVRVSLAHDTIGAVFIRKLVSNSTHNRKGSEGRQSRRGPVARFFPRELARERDGVCTPFAQPRLGRRSCAVSVESRAAAPSGPAARGLRGRHRRHSQSNVRLQGRCPPRF